MSEARIRFAPDILRRLGEELNPSLDQGIVELVKNAYDADALVCTVELSNTDQEGGSIRISDDGDGMDGHDIETSWLVLGRTEKTPRQTTRLGRIPAGSKGLGRLAAIRMGSVARLTTRPRGDRAKEYCVRINWDDFEGVKLVDDVILTIERKPRSLGGPSGSEIVIEKVKSKIGRTDVKRLARAMILLADPFLDNPAGFKPVLVASEFTDLEELVKGRYFNDADYHLIASVSANGRASAKVVDFRGRVLFSCGHDDLSKSREGKPYLCPSADFDLWAFLLISESFISRASSLTAVREWLQEFGGVHVYLNGLRVAPYGNPANDWLDINLRRAQSPEERPSTNTSIGRVKVSDSSGILQQKTDRTGFIENEAFIELKAFAQDAMEWMARNRLRIAELRRTRQRAVAPKKTHKSRQKLEAVVKSVPKASQTKLKQAIGAYDRSRDKEVEQLHKEIQLYRTLSTVGIIAATFAHEASGNPIKAIDQSIRAIERRAKERLGDSYSEWLEKPVNGIVRATKSLAVLATATLELLDHEKRRLSRVDIHEVIKGVLTTFDPFLKGRDVEVETKLCAGSPYLRGSEAAIESILTNLLTNSIAAFERSKQTTRKILIVTEVAGNLMTLRLLDNGQGIEGIDKDDIWLPGQTTRKNGTGLGLTIVRDTVVDIGGEVDAIEHSEIGGAEIIVRIPILGV